MADDGPLDPFDPRFVQRGTEADFVQRGTEADFVQRGTEADDVDRRRQLVHTQGPGQHPDDSKVRILRVAIPLLAFAGLAAIVAVFFSGLSPGDANVVVGPVAQVRQAVAERPYRYCFNGTNPCAWLTVVDGGVVAFNTNGPMAEEYGRQGVGWCPTSGYFGATSTGSVWDQEGRIVEGPSPRSLDQFTTSVDSGDNLVIHFASLTAGLADWQVDGDVTAPSGPLCAEVPFDRDPDLHLDPVR